MTSLYRSGAIVGSLVTGILAAFGCGIAERGAEPAVEHEERRIGATTRTLAIEGMT